MGIRADQDAAVLRETRQRAHRLLKELTEQQAQLESAPGLPAEALDRGRAALAAAVESARRLIDTTDAELRLLNPEP